MWIDATGGEDELGPTRGEKCGVGTSGAGSGSEAGVADIVMWGSGAGAARGIWTCVGSI